MSWRPPHVPYRASDWIRELPFNPKDDHAQAAQLIIEKMAEARIEADDPRERSLDLDGAALVVLLRTTRHAHRTSLSDWLRRNDPDWKVPRALPRGRRIHKYDEHMEGWPEWWASIWGRARANPGRFRGTNIAKQPLAEVYRLVNEWWRVTTGTAFHPNFDGIEPGPDADNLPTMNPAARLFLMIAQDSDRRYNSFHCARVHATAYRDLDTTIP